jgi:hypothetical protein
MQWGRGVSCETCNETWNLGSKSAFVPEATTIMENLDRVGRSQDLPDANRILASSPAFTYRNPNVSSYLCCCFILETFSDCLTEFCYMCNIFDG